MMKATEDHRPWTRGFIGSAFDRFLGWQLGLRAESCNYRAQTLHIPIHEGDSKIDLIADLYEPLSSKDDSPVGTILVQGPYGRGFLFATFFARLFAARGYQVLFVSCRGTFGSEGKWDPFRTEIEDGKAVVEWMRKQPWYTGTFATIGASYLGFTQWALLMDPPQDMVAAVISVGPHNIYSTMWGTGAMNMDLIQWAGMVGNQEENNHVLKTLLQPKRFEYVVNGIPLAQTAEIAYKGKADWLQDWIRNSNENDDYYSPMKLEQSLEQANIPILLFSGWYDIFSDQTFQQYFRLRERGCNVALTVMDATHDNIAIKADVTRDTLHWLDEHVAHIGNNSRVTSMKYYVTGAEEWRSTTEFPPASKPCLMFLKEGNKLSVQPPTKSASSSSFIFDPRDPTPTMGGNTLGTNSGRVEDTALSTRRDVLTFTGETLENDMEFIGKPSVQLFHSTDIAYADLFVRLSEVDENGKSYNISEGYLRLQPKRDTGPINLPLSWCAHRFARGRRVRLILAGASHPHFARNLGVQNLDNTGSDMKAVKHMVFHEVGKISKLKL